MTVWLRCALRPGLNPVGLPRAPADAERHRRQPQRRHGEQPGGNQLALGCQRARLGDRGGAGLCIRGAPHASLLAARQGPGRPPLQRHHRSIRRLQVIKTKPRVERNRVLVTGGAGFVGSHLCEFLVNRGDHVSESEGCTPSFSSSRILGPPKRQALPQQESERPGSQGLHAQAAAAGGALRAGCSNAARWLRPAACLAASGTALVASSGTRARRHTHARAHADAWGHAQRQAGTRRARGWAHHAPHAPAPAAGRPTLPATARAPTPAPR